jgi:hypothetical protein
VRDIYDVDADHLLIVTTDRLSAFDVVLPDPIPLKGDGAHADFPCSGSRKPVTSCRIILTDVKPQDVVADPEERAQLAGRSMVVRKLDALPIEAVVRGYLIGSGFKDYQLHGSVCGIALPARIANGTSDCRSPSSRRPGKRPPASTIENIDFEAIVKLVGREHATLIRRIALEIYRFAAEHARARAHHHRRYEIRIRHRQSRQFAADRRSIDARFFALLADGVLQTRNQSAELRQAIRARLSGIPCTGTSGRRRRICRRTFWRAPATIIARRLQLLTE